MERRSLLKSVLAFIPASIIGSKTGFTDSRKTPIVSEISTISKARIEKYKDENGLIVEKTYGKNGNLLSSDSNGYCITFDENGNQLSYKNSNGYRRKKICNDKGQELTYKDSEGYSEEHTYNENGQVLTFNNSKGTWRKHIYDKQGIKLSSVESNGRSVEIITIEYI